MCLLVLRRVVKSEVVLELCDLRSSIAVSYGTFLNIQYFIHHKVLPRHLSQTRGIYDNMTAIISRCTRNEHLGTSAASRAMTKLLVITVLLAVVPTCCSAFLWNSAGTRSIQSTWKRRSVCQLFKDKKQEKTPLFGITSLERLNASKDESGDSSLFPSGMIPSLDSTVIAKQMMTITEPMQEALDGITDGWALMYADLSPDNPQTLPGQAFLATNAAYLVAGVLLTITGDFWFGFWTDVAAVASFNYHYNQLISAGQAKVGSVRLALVLDYIAAAVSMFTALVYLLSNSTLPVEALGVSVAGLAFLYLSWVWEYGQPYMIFHSLWHLCSAYAGYLIGTMHAAGGGN